MNWADGRSSRVKHRTVSCDAPGCDVTAVVSGPLWTDTVRLYLDARDSGWVFARKTIPSSRGPLPKPASSESRT